MNCLLPHSDTIWIHFFFILSRIMWEKYGHFIFTTPLHPDPHLTVVQSKLESRLKYWATHSFVCLFAYTPQSFAGSALLACALRCTHLFSRSLTHSLLSSWGSEWSDSYFCCVFCHLDHSAPFLSESQLWPSTWSHFLLSFCTFFPSDSIFYRFLAWLKRT